MIIFENNFTSQVDLVDDFVKTPDPMKSGVINAFGKSIPFTDLTISPTNSAKSSSKRDSSEECHISPECNNVSATSKINIKKIKIEKD